MENRAVILETDECLVEEHVGFVQGQDEAASDRISENTQDENKSRNYVNIRHQTLDEFRNPFANRQDAWVLKRRTHSVDAVSYSTKGCDPLNL